MAQTDTPKLDEKSTFPGLTLDLAEGGSLSLPAKQWTMLLIYRGDW